MASLADCSAIVSEDAYADEPELEVASSVEVQCSKLRRRECGCGTGEEELEESDETWST